jgi:hypothetical protein
MKYCQKFTRMTTLTDKQCKVSWREDTNVCVCVAQYFVCPSLVTLHKMKKKKPYLKKKTTSRKGRVTFDCMNGVSDGK